MTVHFVDEMFQRVDLVAGVSFLKEHTGEKIGQAIQAVLNLCKLEEKKITCVVRDGASNMKNSCDFLNMKR